LAPFLNLPGFILPSANTSSLRIILFLGTALASQWKPNFGRDAAVGKFGQAHPSKREGARKRVRKLIDKWPPPAIGTYEAAHGLADDHSAGAVLDLAFLRAQTFADHALAAELLATFKGQAERLLFRLQSPKPRQLRERADDAHLLKGSARAIGAFRMGGLAEQYEGLVLAGNVDEADALIAELGAAFREVSGAIAEVLATDEALAQTLAEPIIRGRADGRAAAGGGPCAKET
jgi:HPt (histidine-containing phosphotransfer) domain-containing protein